MNLFALTVAMVSKDNPASLYIRRCITYKRDAFKPKCTEFEIYTVIGTTNSLFFNTCNCVAWSNEFNLHRTIAGHSNIPIIFMVDCYEIGYKRASIDGKR